MAGLQFSTSSIAANNTIQGGWPVAFGIVDPSGVATIKRLGLIEGLEISVEQEEVDFLSTGFPRKTINTFISQISVNITGSLKEILDVGTVHGILGTAALTSNDTYMRIGSECQQKSFFTFVAQKDVCGGGEADGDNTIFEFRGYKAAFTGSTSITGEEINDMPLTIRVYEDVDGTFGAPTPQELGYFAKLDYTPA